MNKGTEAEILSFLNGTVRLAWEWGRISKLSVKKRGFFQSGHSTLRRRTGVSYLSCSIPTLEFYDLMKCVE